MNLIDVVPAVTAALEAILVLICLYQSFRYYKYVQFLNNIPTARIRSAPQGYVELIGKARPMSASPLYVPDTDIPCVWYEAEYRIGYGDDSQTIYKRADQSFLIDDDTGTCRIDPWNIKFITKNSKKRSLAGSLVETPGLTWVRWIGVGEEVHVYGNYTSLYIDYRKQEQDLKKSRLKKLKNDHERLMKYDKNRDGDISIDEWEEARQDVDEEVDRYIMDKQTTLKDNFYENVLRPPADSHLPYLVSAYRERGIIMRYRIYSGGYFLGGLASLYLCLTHL